MVVALIDLICDDGGLRVATCSAAEPLEPGVCANLTTGAAIAPEGGVLEVFDATRFVFHG
jgi:hypothetical protein